MKYLFATLIASLTLGCDLSLEPGGRSATPNAGMPMPTIEAFGWLNGSAPAEADLAGKVVVLDCFATW